MYWGDARDQRIEAANIDGSGRRLILTDSRARYYTFAFHDGFIYYANWNHPYMHIYYNPLRDVGRGL